MAGGETDRSLNRALLARQGLLEPFDAGVVEVVEAIGALQAQAWAAPPLALWSRMRAFETQDLYDALARRELVVGINLRATLHLVSAREHPAYHAVVEGSGADRLAAHEGAVLRTRCGRRCWRTWTTPRTGEEIAAFADAWVEEHPGAIADEELERPAHAQVAPAGALERAHARAGGRHVEAPRRRWRWSRRRTLQRARTTRSTP